MHDLLRTDFPGVNHKRVCRLYSDANLAVRKRKKVRRPAARTPLNIATQVNEVWSMDFVSDSLANGRRLKCMTVTDDFKTPQWVMIAFDGGGVTRRGVEMVAGSPLFRGLSILLLMSGRQSGEMPKSLAWAGAPWRPRASR